MRVDSDIVKERHKGARHGGGRGEAKEKQGKGSREEEPRVRRINVELGH